jgi:hypothetical protein
MKKNKRIKLSKSDKILIKIKSKITKLYSNISHIIVWLGRNNLLDYNETRDGKWLQEVWTPFIESKS